MTMMVGIGMVVLLFMALVIVLVKIEGWKATAIILGLTALVMAWIVMASVMIAGGR